MILDNFLMFTGTSNGATGGITSGANTDAPTTGTQTASNIVDLGVGTVTNEQIPTFARGGGARDIGVGDSPALKLLVRVTTTFTGGTNMAVDLSGAPDDGAGGQGAYVVMWLGPTVVEANLIAGADLANVDVPRVIPTQPIPRFLRLRFITSGTHGAGKVEGCIVLDRDDQIKGTTGALSGYPAGVNIAN